MIPNARIYEVKLTNGLSLLRKATTAIHRKMRRGSVAEERTGVHIPSLKTRWTQ